MIANEALLSTPQSSQFAQPSFLVSIHQHICRPRTSENKAYIGPHAASGHLRSIPSWVLCSKRPAVQGGVTLPLRDSKRDPGSAGSLALWVPLR